MIHCSEHCGSEMPDVKGYTIYSQAYPRNIEPSFVLEIFPSDADLKKIIS